MKAIRIANFIIQSAYLTGHLLFILELKRKRQPTPVWSWFFVLSIALWAWVSGRFMETLVYLFLPENNGAYVFAANFQYIGDTLSVVAYVIWILYLSGMDRLASDRRFRAFVFACPVLTCVLVFTNGRHHLFYTKLIMGERVAHGWMFLPCMAWLFLILMCGYAISIRFLLRTGRDRLKQIVMFSIFPLLPAIGVLVRSISGIDKLDYTPMVMAAAMISLYQIIFKYRYVNIVSASIREVIEQTAHPIGIYDRGLKRLTYANRIAREEYADAADGLALLLAESREGFDGTYKGRQLSVDATPLPDGDSILVTVADTTEIAREQAALDRKIQELEDLRRKLEESNRNIDAYIESLNSTDGIARKQRLIRETRTLIAQTFQRAEENLISAKRDPLRAPEALNDNLRLTRTCIAAIRSAVAQLKGVDHGSV